MNLPTISIDLDKAATYSKEELHNFICDLEQVLKKFPQMDLPLNHYHANAGTEDGIYGRELPIPKGTLIVGKIHRLQCINVVNRGHVTVISIDGVMNLEAGDIFVSSPGAKRFIIAHEDSSWTTFHATGETDQEKIEQKFTLKSFDELQNKEVLKLEEVCLSSQ